MGRLYKRYETGYEEGKRVPDGTLLLAGCAADLEGEILFERGEFTQSDLDELFDVKTGEWYAEDGWIVGKNPKRCPGMIVSKRDFFGAVMVDITAKLVAPSTHDINVMINGEWDDAENKRGNAYVAGLEAFWHGNVGFEKSPDYKLTVATQLLDFDPEKEYRFRFANLGGKLFVLVDDRLSLEITDPDPIDADKYGKIGFEAFSSWWKFKNLKVRRVTSVRAGGYNEEF